MADETTTDQKKSDILNLFDGEELTDNGLGEITSEVDGKLVLLLGEPSSGKTTLFASLFDQFQKGPVADYLFAGSKTQIGFEKRCHFARVVSKGVHSNTERTFLSNGISYLHLAVRKKKIRSTIATFIFCGHFGRTI
jgi:hypothetical protein